MHAASACCAWHCSAGLTAFDMPSAQVYEDNKAAVGLQTAPLDLPGKWAVAMLRGALAVPGAVSNVQASHLQLQQGRTAWKCTLQRRTTRCCGWRAASESSAHRRWLRRRRRRQARAQPQAAESVCHCVTAQAHGTCRLSPVAASSASAMPTPPQQSSCCQPIVRSRQPGAQATMTPGRACAAWRTASGSSTARRICAARRQRRPAPPRRASAHAMPCCGTLILIRLCASAEQVTPIMVLFLCRPGRMRWTCWRACRRSARRTRQRPGACGAAPSGTAQRRSWCMRMRTRAAAAPRSRRRPSSFPFSGRRLSGRCCSRPQPRLDLLTGSAELEAGTALKATRQAMHCIYSASVVEEVQIGKLRTCGIPALAQLEARQRSSLRSTHT